MARVSIYVSDELKARMIETGDALNWSDIARPAFETAIANFNHRKGRNMSTMIERLRASKAEMVRDQSEGGKRSGQEWAANRASFEDLKRVSEIDVANYDHGPSLIWRAIKAAVDPNEDCDDGEIFTHLFGDEEKREGEWLVAWVEGAQETFAEVEDQI